MRGHISTCCRRLACVSVWIVALEGVPFVKRGAATHGHIWPFLRVVGNFSANDGRNFVCFIHSFVDEFPKN